ncbi:MAG: glycogen synthase, partial [Bifidobacteriaceae bacterium]|nr:glycogen synthase [Bifidobacteriaceae bacterium]
MTPTRLRVDLMTREYPPSVYGGAGVHVAELAKVLRQRLDLAVRCFGPPRDEPGVFAYPEPDPAALGNPALAVFATDLAMAGGAAGA